MWFAAANATDATVSPPRLQHLHKKSYRARCVDATIGSVCSLCGLWFWVGCRWLNKPGINMFTHINTHTTVLSFFLALGLKIQFHHLEPMGLSWTVTHLLESQCRWPILISRDTHSVWVIDWWDFDGGPCRRMNECTYRLDKIDSNTNLEKHTLFLSISIFWLVHT